LSRLYLYYNARYATFGPNRPIEDRGCHIEPALQALKSYGICQEEYWPFIDARVNYQPYSSCYQQYKKFIPFSYRRLGNQIETMKSYLEAGYPLVIGARIYSQFHEAAYYGGAVHHPNEYEKMTATNNGHAMLVVGYTDSYRAFIVRNSYGPQWGNQGYGYFPYSYLGDPFLCSDIYSIESDLAQNLVNRHLTIDDNYTYYGASEPTDDQKEKLKTLFEVKEIETSEGSRKLTDEEREQMNKMKDFKNDDNQFKAPNADDSKKSSQTEKDVDAKKHVIKNYVV